MSPKGNFRNSVRLAFQYKKIPDLQLFVVAGRAINANDILPTTHTVSALGRVLNYGAGLDEVAFELGAIAVLTVAFYALGTWAFTRRHMRAA